jgi:hypothetical protein
MTEEQIEAAKNMAAVKALEAYGKALEEVLGEVAPESLDQTEHIHTAVLLGKEGKAVAIISHWKFTTDPQVIAKLVKMKKNQGVA